MTTVTEKRITFHLRRDDGPNRQYAEAFLAKEGGVFEITITDANGVTATAKCPARSLVKELTQELEAA